jgi:hypothetical protein
MHVIRDKTIHPDTFRRVKGEDLSREWLDQDPLAMTEPIVIENAEGLGMRMPGKEFTVNNVAELVGPDTPVEVMGECSLYYLYPDSSHCFRRLIPVHITGMDSWLLG